MNCEMLITSMSSSVPLYADDENVFAVAVGFRVSEVPEPSACCDKRMNNNH
jgi:hypothetical protein